VPAGLGNPDDAADAAQDALLAMVRKLDGFRGEAAFTTWLYRVAMNVCYDHLRRARRQPMLRGARKTPARARARPRTPWPTNDVAGARAGAEDSASRRAGRRHDRYEEMRRC
jgi:RNA polymerase sigma factor (sigma-70 family)